MFDELQSIIRESQKIVFFGGAGVSTESGIPDFRGVDGLYRQKYANAPEEILSHHFFVQHPEEFFRFYRDKMLYLNAKPNAAHLKLADLERRGKLLAVITQNIDGLHQMAGSRNVYELHGSVLRNHCQKCGESFSAQDILQSTGVPHCPCGGMIKPDVVLYEESLDSRVLEGAVRRIEEADTLIVAGTSLTVYPAAGLIQYFRGKHLVLINRDATPADRTADLVIRGKVGEVFKEIEG